MTTEMPAGDAEVDGSSDQTDRLRGAVQRNSLYVLVVIALILFVFMPFRIAAGFLAGGAISLLNFRDLRKSLETFMEALLKGKRGGEGGLVARYYLKLGLTLIVLAALIKSGRVDLWALLCGLFVVPGTIIFTGIRMYIGSFGGKV